MAKNTQPVLKRCKALGLSPAVLGYSKELLFDETMRAYQATLTICAPEEEINIQPEDTVANCDDYFLGKLANNRQKRVGDGLFFMDYNTLDPNYLAKFVLRKLIVYILKKKHYIIYKT